MITVTINGRRGEGKTTIAKIIGQALEAHGLTASVRSPYLGLLNDIRNKQPVPPLHPATVLIIDEDDTEVQLEPEGPPCRPSEEDPPIPDFVPQSQAFQDLVRKTKTHHPACGCGACCALSGWSVEDDERACQAERERDVAEGPKIGLDLVNDGQQPPDNLLETNPIFQKGNNHGKGDKANREEEGGQERRQDFHRRQEEGFPEEGNRIQTESGEDFEPPT